MKKEYDFSKGERGAIVPAPAGKTRITIRLDNDIIEWFRSQVEGMGGGNYQTMINNALKDHINNPREADIKSIRSVIQEEFQKVAYLKGPINPFSETAENEKIRRDFPDFKMESISDTHMKQYIAGHAIGGQS
ncbi:hypothetical protein ES708_11136 [subsurface metagenome]